MKIRDFMKQRGSRTLLRKLIDETCKYAMSSGQRDSYFTAHNYTLRISRESSYKDPFYLTLEDEDGEELDSFKFYCLGTKDAYSQIQACLRSAQ